MYRYYSSDTQTADLCNMLRDMFSRIITADPPVTFNDIYGLVYELVRLRRVPIDIILDDVNTGTVQGLLRHPVSKVDYDTAYSSTIRDACKFMTYYYPTSMAALQTVIEDAWATHEHYYAIGTAHPGPKAEHEAAQRH